MSGGLIKKSNVFIFLLFSLLSFFYGCSFPSSLSDQKNPEILIGRMTPAVKIDGILSDSEWKDASFYSFTETDRIPGHSPQLAEAIRNMIVEKGSAALKYDEKYLYIAARLEDKDIVAYGERDQIHHYSYGDTVELFLKPDEKPCYFEMFFTPNNKYSTFFFESYFYPGSDRPENLFRGVLISVQRSGTLNCTKDNDLYWTLEAAIPVSEIERFTGVPFRKDRQWRCLIVRYNYGYLFARRQRTSVPKIPSADYHDSHHYAIMKFQ